MANALQMSAVLVALLASTTQDPAAPPGAGDPAAPLATIAWESTVRPPMRDIIQALKRSRLLGLSARIRLDCDADGNVTEAALLESTGNEVLDQEIVEWARDVKLKPCPIDGRGVLPMTLMRPR